MLRLLAIAAVLGLSAAQFWPSGGYPYPAPYGAYPYGFQPYGSAPLQMAFVADLSSYPVAFSSCPQTKGDGLSSVECVLSW